MKALAVGCFLVCSVPGFAHAIAFNKTTPSGKAIQVHVYHSWNVDCVSIAGVVKVLGKPAHGRIANHVVNSKITTDHMGRPVRCAGTPIKALEVIYTPERGFRGTDNFTLDATWGSGEHDVDTYTINVQ
jgi:hypothetical protein